MFTKWLYMTEQEGRI